MKVYEVMNRNVISLSPEDTTACAARLLSRHNIGSVPVVSQDGKLKGILTDRDIVLRCVANECDADITPVKEIMTRGVVSISPDADLREAAQLMATEQIRRLPVVKENHIVGMLSLGDMAKTHSYDMEASKALSDISMPKTKYYREK